MCWEAWRRKTVQAPQITITLTKRSIQGEWRRHPTDRNKWKSRVSLLIMTILGVILSFLWDPTYWFEMCMSEKYCSCSIFFNILLLNYSLTMACDMLLQYTQEQIFVEKYRFNSDCIRNSWGAKLGWGFFVVFLFCFVFYLLWAVDSSWHKQHVPFVV